MLSFPPGEKSAEFDRAVLHSRQLSSVHLLSRLKAFLIDFLRSLEGSLFSRDDFGHFQYGFAFSLFQYFSPRNKIPADL